MSALWLGLVLSAAPDPLTFEAAVQQALINSTALRLGQAEVDRAGALVQQARAPSLPTLALNGTYTRLEGDRGINGNVISAANQLGANLQLQLPLVVPNRWAQWRRAELNATVSTATQEETRRQVALTAGRAWLAVLGQKKVVVAQQRSLDVAKAHLQYASDRRTGGIGNRLDEARAAQELAVTQTQLASALGTLERLQEQLGVAVGVDGPLDASEVEPSLPAAVAPERVSQVINERSDVQAAVTRVETAKNSIRWNWADYSPLLSAVVTPAYQNPATATVPTLGFQAQLVLSIPLYDGGLRYGQQRERQLQLEQAKVQLEAASRSAAAEVRTGLSQVRRADESLAAARDAATQAEGALALSQDAFRAGGSTNLEVVDAERRARDAATAVALAENAARQARLELLGAAGLFPSR